MADTGQQFIDTRQATEGAEPLEVDSGMGALPEALDMAGETCITAIIANGSRHYMRRQKL